MAVLATNYPTLADVAKRLDPDGKVASVAEILSQSNEILMDCYIKEGNLPTGDQVTIRTGLPAVYWRALNQGIPATHSTTAQVTETCGLLEARSEIDCDVADLNGNTAQFRLSEDVAHMEAMNQTQASTMIYGNPAVDPKQYLGLAARYSSLSAGNAQNVMSAGGSSGLTSIYLVGWGDQTVYCPFPKGSMAGLKHENLGKYTAQFSDNTRMEVYGSRYQWKTGLVVKDWRYVVRICNISVSDLLGVTGTQALTASTHIHKLMARAYYRLVNIAGVRPAFYMNRTVHSGLAISSMDRSQNVVKVEEGLTQFGTPHSWLSFLGVPIRRVDSILNTEAAVS